MRKAQKGGWQQYRKEENKHLKTVTLPTRLSEGTSFLPLSSWVMFSPFIQKSVPEVYKKGTVAIKEYENYFL